MALACLATAALGASLTSCGGGGGTSTGRRGSTVVVEHVVTVSRELGPLDEDDFAEVNYGQPMKGRQKRTAIALLKRYYKTAVAEDGATACSFLFSVAAKEVVEEQHDWHVHGNSCPTVVTAIFRRLHRLLVAEARSMRVVRAGAYGPNGRLILRVANSPEAREFRLRMVAGKWTVQYPMDSALP
jgi:hypothetical protein